MHMIAVVMAVAVDVVDMRMGVVVMRMDVVTPLLFSVDSYRQMCAPDPAFFHRLCFIENARDPKAVEFSDHGFRIGMKLKQGCAEHVSRRSHIAFKVQSFQISDPPAHLSKFYSKYELYG